MLKLAAIVNPESRTFYAFDEADMIAKAFGHLPKLHMDEILPLQYSFQKYKPDDSVALQLFVDAATNEITRNAAPEQIVKKKKKKNKTNENITRQTIAALKHTTNLAENNDTNSGSSYDCESPETRW